MPIYRLSEPPSMISHFTECFKSGAGRVTRQTWISHSNWLEFLLSNNPQGTDVSGADSVPAGRCFVPVICCLLGHRTTWGRDDEEECVETVIIRAASLPTPAPRLGANLFLFSESFQALGLRDLGACLSPFGAYLAIPITLHGPPSQASSGQWCWNYDETDNLFSAAQTKAKDV